MFVYLLCLDTQIMPGVVTLFHFSYGHIMYYCTLARVWLVFMNSQIINYLQSYQSHLT